MIFFQHFLRQARFARMRRAAYQNNHLQPFAVIAYRLEIKPLKHHYA